MECIKLISWNVNGIRSVIRKGFWDWLEQNRPEVLCLQETKAHLQQVGTLLLPVDYHVSWFAAARRGYSGVATLSAPAPVSEHHGLGQARYDLEGRIITTVYPHFTLLNIYFPNSQRELVRLDYKLAFCEDLLLTCQNLRKAGHKLVLCGDFNIAHEEIDLRNPKENMNNAGFSAPERAWMSRFLALGYIDIFRYLHPQEPDHYTWWTYRVNARERNIGWRIDYFIISDDLLPTVRDATLEPGILGSDHCPVTLQLCL